MNNEEILNTNGYQKHEKKPNLWFITEEKGLKHYINLRGKPATAFRQDGDGGLVNDTSATFKSVKANSKNQSTLPLTED